MISRKGLLVLSVLISLLMHAVFLWAVAPNVKVMQSYQVPEDVLRTFQIKLIDDPMEAPSSPGDGGSLSLASRPGAIEDMMTREEILQSLDSFLDEPVAVPQMAERATSESLPREHEIETDPQLADRLDAKILEISESVARDDIQITRRLVRPSPVRVLGEGELPTLRSEGDAGLDEMLLLDPLSPRLAGELAGPPGEGGAGTGITAPPASEPELPAELEAADGSGLNNALMATATKLPELPVEPMMARVPIEQEIRQETRFDFMDELVDMHVDTFLPPGQDYGYFRLRILPKKGGNIEVLPKDVTFVIDASNSILQRKLDATAQGVQRIIDMLRPQDRFNVIVFRDSPAPFQEDLVYATEEAKAAARAYLASLQSRGETDVYKAMQPVLTQTPRAGVPSIVVVLSDGRPTTGIRDGRDIINGLTNENNDRNTIFAFGGGRTVNQPLLDLLSYRNKGEARVVDDIALIDRALPEFFDQLNDPLLVDLNADFGRINDSEVYPKDVPDFYMGKAVTIYGRFNPDQDSEFAIRLTGRAADRKKEIVFPADLQSASTGNNEIARGWALSKIYHIISEMAAQGEKPELLAELRSLSRQYGISTSYD